MTGDTSTQSPSGFHIRPARPDDCAVIAEFNARLALETESKRLDPSVLARGVSLALADPDRARYFVAVSDEGAVIGQTAFTREWSDWRCGWIWWLQSVYVAADHRGRGVFRALFESIREEARAAGSEVIGLRLYVEQENEKAQRVYEAMGLRPGGYFVLEDLWGLSSPPD
jgi:GNAT superfamily N-acetyltransferase